MKKTTMILAIMLCSFTMLSFSKREAFSVNEINFFKDGFHVQVFYDNFNTVTGIAVTLGGPNTPGFYSWTPLPGTVSSGCFTGVIYVEDTPEGQVILDITCNN